MFGSIAAMAVIGAINEIKMIDHDNKMFELSIAELEDDQKLAVREKRRLEKREDRMHREMCQAIRDSKPEANNGIGMAGLILAASLINNG